MSTTGTLVAARAALLLALVFNPYLLARHCCRRADAAGTFAAWFASLLLLNTAWPVLLTVLGKPVNAGSLATGHAVCFLLLTVTAVVRSLPLKPAPTPAFARPWLFLFLFALLVLPFTRMAGIDTYKWQDLASSVQTEQRVAWLVHPLSLFGYTPRSYPSAQPLLLATIEVLGGTGVDWGFYILSVLCGAGALFTALLLGRRLFATEQTARDFALLYVFSPVLLRYAFWATGRGYFLALYPLLLWGLLELPHARGTAALAACAALLPMTHKLGGIALCVVPLVFVASLALTALRAGRRSMALLFTLSLLSAAALTPGRGVARILSFLWQPASRLALLAPLSLAGFLLPGTAAGQPAWRAMQLGWLVTMPLVFAGEMYGALLALPFAACMAAVGLNEVCQRVAAHARYLRRAVGGVVALTSLAIIVHLSRHATPEAVYQAARFLEAHDPRGPYRIEAAGQTRTQIQGYVSGCPRFTVTATAEASPRLRTPPRRTGNLRRDYQQWVNYLRAIVELPDVATAWYGATARVYYVSGPGAARPRLPPGVVCIHERDGVAVYAAATDPHADAHAERQ
mgnify:CR=1 FL=1